MNSTSSDTYTLYPDESHEPQRFDDYTSYRIAFTATLSLASHSLLLCERNFSESPLGSVAVEQLLTAFLTRPGKPQLQLLCFEGDYLASQCPRFLRLYQRFGHSMAMHLINEDAHTQWDKGFIVADRQHYMQRHHFDWPRGETGTNPQTIMGLEQAFQQLWAISGPSLGWQRLEI